MSTRIPVTDPEHDRPEPAAHTPGPWSTRRGVGNDGDWVILNGNSAAAGKIAVVFDQLDHYSIDLPVEANARLIAAAPDLLAALLEVEAHHVEINGNAGRPEDHSMTLRIVRAAIAKAAGKVPA